MPKEINIDSTILCNIIVLIFLFAAFDTPTLINRVSAKIVGIPFPFIGVDGTDACKTIYKEDGMTLAGCPLKKGETYVFKNQFDILSIYPTVIIFDSSYIQQFLNFFHIERVHHNIIILFIVFISIIHNYDNMIGIDNFILNKFQNITIEKLNKFNNRRKI